MVTPAMPHTYSNLLSHIVFSTKDRKPLIDSALEDRLFPYLGGILRELGCTLLIVNGVDDHIHLLAKLIPSVAVADLVGKIKGSSSHWVHDAFPDQSRFGWQRGYAAFSVSKSSARAVARYIEGQKAHHRKQSFHDVFVELLRRHDIAAEERFLWT